MNVADPSAPTGLSYPAAKLLNLAVQREQYSTDRAAGPATRNRVATNCYDGRRYKIMRVMLLSRSFYPSLGGIENSLYYIASTLKAMGHEPVIFAGRHDKSLGPRSIVNGIEVLRYTYSLPKWMLFWDPLLHTWAAAQRLKEVFEKNPVDVVWCRMAFLCYAVQKANFYGPVVFIPPVLSGLFYREVTTRLQRTSVRGIVLHTMCMIQSPQKTYIERIAFQNSDAIVTFSENMSSQVVRGYPFTKGKVSVVRPGVDVDKFVPQEPNRELMQAYALTEQESVFLYVGRLSPEKNIEALIKAFSMARRRADRLIIVGDGFHRHVLEQLCVEFGLEDKVIFAGYQENPAPFYNLAHFLVLPTLYEGFGQVYLEALASGVPCIGYAGQFTATAEIIKDRVNGFVVYEHSLEALAEAMHQTHGLSEHEYQRMRTNARDSILKDYRWEHFVSSVLALSKPC